MDERSDGMTRRVVAGVLVALSCVAFFAGGVGVWANRSLLDTDVWVERAGPLIDDPDVQAALSAKITTEILTLVDSETWFDKVLPERGRPLAGPLSDAVRTLIRDQADRVVSSDAFAPLWVAVNERAHTEAVKVLRGDVAAVQAGDDTVTLDLVPVINQVLENISAAMPELFGRTVETSDVLIDESPADAIDRLERAFGIDLPADFGQITIYDEGALKNIQVVVAWLDRLVWLSIVVLASSAIGALALSVDRRRTSLQLVLMALLSLILLRLAAITAQNQLLDLVRGSTNVRAVTAVSDALLQGLFNGTRTLLWSFGVVAVLIWVTGPSGRAARLRRKVSHPRS